MNVKITITTEWDREKGESLKDFNVRRTRFMEHVTRMQLNGSLPRTDISWQVTTRKVFKMDAPKDVPPASFVDSGHGLVPVHQWGDRLL
jgi:hypothetical protein